jgi:hypothetical protein
MSSPEGTSVPYIILFLNCFHLPESWNGDVALLTSSLCHEHALCRCDRTGYVALPLNKGMKLQWDPESIGNITRRGVAKISGRYGVVRCGYQRI